MTDLGQWGTTSFPQCSLTAAQVLEVTSIRGNIHIYEADIIIYENENSIYNINEYEYIFRYRIWYVGLKES